MKLGQIKLQERKHPDSLGIKVWEVLQVQYKIGKYAKQRELYWANIGPIEPFTSKDIARNYIKGLT